MALRFTVLASGSAGNATLVETTETGVLLDVGLGQRDLTERLSAAGASWARVHAVVLTHTHSDHWNDATLAHLVRRRTVFYCHPSHHGVLSKYSRAYGALQAAELVRPYHAGQPFEPAPGLRCVPLPVRHDGGETFGFRLEGAGDLFGQCQAIGYVADLGCWDAELAQALADVDILAVEFNHDVPMQCSSGRMPQLIMRVLGDEGHLSNEQGAALVRAVLSHSTPGKVQHVVQLHLSRDCNRPALALEAAQTVLADLTWTSIVHTAAQDRVTPSIDLGGPLRRRVRRGTRGTRRTAAPTPDPWLPGFEENGDPD